MSEPLLPPPTGVAVSPAPTDEEAVAIMAAAEALWPKPVIATPARGPRRSRSWRFSGRWWNRPTPLGRDRP